MEKRELRLAHSASMEKRELRLAQYKRRKQYGPLSNYEPA